MTHLSALFPLGWHHCLIGGRFVGLGTALLFVLTRRIGGLGSVFSTKWSYLVKRPLFFSAGQFYGFAPMAAGVRGGPDAGHGWCRRLAMLALLAGPYANVQAFLGRVDFSDAGDFSEAAIVRGVQATPAQCAAAANTVWADAKEAGAECLKYWKGGFTTLPVKRVLVFFHGDIFVGTGKTGKSYIESSNEILQRNADAWGKQLGVPYIFVGRPGTHGSSGDHMQRRRTAESKIISAALDTLKVRYGVQEWVVAGQSGGGHATSSLITMRNDIVCAVPTSAPSSPRIRWELMGRTRDTTNYDDSYEPHRFIEKNKTHPGLRVFVLGNPQDRNVFWASQTVMADALRQAGVAVQVLQGEGSGPDAHGLSNSARVVAGWCARDMGTTDMLERASKGLKG